MRNITRLLSIAFVFCVIIIACIVDSFSFETLIILGAPIIHIIFIVFIIKLLSDYSLPKAFRNYPYMKNSFDVSGHRLPIIDNYVSGWLRCSGFEAIKYNEEKIKLWEQDTERFIESCRNPGKRRKQYEKILCNNKAKTYYFELTRRKTVYYQRNNIKYSKIQSVVCDHKYYSYEELKQIYNNATNIK